MMWTFDEKKLGKRPPPFAYTPSKNLGRWVYVDRAEHNFFFKDMRGKGTITISGGKNSLIQKLSVYHLLINKRSLGKPPRTD
jgi:hypothetical protein